MAVLPVATGYRLGSKVAQALPWGPGEAVTRGLGRLAGHVDRDRRRLVERHVRRVRGDHLHGSELRRAVDAVFASYASYWYQSLRLPGLSPDQIGAGFTEDGFEHVIEARESGRGVILALPHLGGWDWAGFWISRVVGYPVAAVVEALEPPELFEWFREFRRGYGIEVIPLDAEAGTAVQRALAEDAPRAPHSRPGPRPRVRGPDPGSPRAVAPAPAQLAQRPRRCRGRRPGSGLASPPCASA